MVNIARRCELYLVLLGLLFAGWQMWQVVKLDQAQDLHPRPDALEYACSGASLAQGRGHTLWLLDTPYPPRYPYGYPLLIALFYWVIGIHLEWAWVTGFLGGLLSLLGVYLVGRTLAGRWVGAIAVWLLLTSDVFLEWVGYAMSEFPSLAIALLVAWYILKVPDAYSFSKCEIFWLGLLSGYPIAIRFPNIALTVILAWLVYQKSNTPPPQWQQALVWLVGAGIPVAGLFYFNWRNFGNPMMTGYGYWPLPPELVGTDTKYFDWSHIWSGAAEGLEKSNCQYYWDLLRAKHHGLYPELTRWLVVAGVVCCFVFDGKHGLRKKATQFLFACFFCWSVLFVFVLPYFLQFPRLVVAGVPWVLVLAAVGVVVPVRILVQKAYCAWDTHKQFGWGWYVACAGLMVFIIMVFDVFRDGYENLERWKDETRAHQLIALSDRPDYEHSYNPAASKDFVPLSHASQWMPSDAMVIFSHHELLAEHYLRSIGHPRTLISLMPHMSVSSHLTSIYRWDLPVSYWARNNPDYVRPLPLFVNGQPTERLWWLDQQIEAGQSVYACGGFSDRAFEQWEWLRESYEWRPVKSLPWPWLLIFEGKNPDAPPLPDLW